MSLTSLDTSFVAAETTTTNDRVVVANPRATPIATSALRVLRAAYLPDVVFLVLCVLVGRARYRILANGEGLPGYDPGNWLAFANSMLGHGARSSSLVYPPIVPLLTKAFANLWGPTVGISRLAALVSILPAIGVYLVSRSAGARWSAVFVGGLVVSSAAVGEATAWGGYPQLIGLGLLPVAMWRWDQFCARRRWRDSVLSGFIVGTMLLTSHFIAMATVVAMAAITVQHLAATTSRGALLHAWPRALAAAVPVLPLVPWYLHFSSGISGNVSTRHGLVTNPFNATRLHELLFLARESPTLWRIVFLAPLVALAARWPRRDTMLWRLVAAGIASTVLLMAYLGDPRVMYLFPSFAVLALVLLIDDATTWARRSARPRHRTLALIAMCALCAVLGGMLARHTMNGIAFFKIQRSYYGIVNPSIEESMQWVYDNTPSDALIATPPIDGGPWGWWIEGLAERHTLVGSKLQWLNFSDEQQRASDSANVFATFPSLDSIERAHASGVDYLLVPKKWEGYDAFAMQRLAFAHPELIAFENDGAIVVIVRLS